MEDIVLIMIIPGVIGGIVWYLLRAKKKGEKCIGCPCAKQCLNKHKACNNKERNDKTNVN